MRWSEMRLIVVPVDFSDESIAAIDTALEITDDPAKVRAIHVLAEIVAAEPGVIWQEVDEQSRCEHANKALREKLAQASHGDIETEIRVGDAGYRIAKFAEDAGADLIVMPSHGRSGLKRVLIGSVAERVVRLAHCPVMVLHG